MDQEIKPEGACRPTTPGEMSECSSGVSETILSSFSDSSEDNPDHICTPTKSVLNFSSKGFSPTLALQCEKSAVPTIEGAKQYLNIHQYSKAVQAPNMSPRRDVACMTDLAAQRAAKLNAQESAQQGPSTSQESSMPSQEFPIPGRRFLPHQMPVFRPRKEHPNTITIMNTIDGPLGVLRRIMIEKTRTKIWTRNDKGFRGYLTGFVEAFDKHWNIALRDVDEQFVRKRAINFPIIGDNSHGRKPLEEAVNVQLETTPQITSGNNNKNDDERRREAAISSAFIRLETYLRQNDGMARKQMEYTTSSSTTLSTGDSNKRKGCRRKFSPSKNPNSEIKSKTVYVGDMDPLSICRAGLAKLTLNAEQRESRIQVGLTADKMLTDSPDIVQCHQRRSTRTRPGPEFASSSTSGATSTTGTSSTPHHHQQANNISRTALKKKSLTVFKTPYEDSFGFMVVAQTKKYELVQRHLGQVLLMGNDIVFIETSGGAC